MKDPSRIHVSVTGVLNGTYFSGWGSLIVDSTLGTKTGTIVYDPFPEELEGAIAGPDCVTILTTRCFVGAKLVGRERFPGPLDLLGREFMSIRSTTIGRRGIMNVSESARIRNRTLVTKLTGVGQYKLPKDLKGLGPLREVITVGDHQALTSRGRYSLQTKSGRSIPVRYTHFYQPLKPNARLLRGLRGQKYLLRATITVTPIGKLKGKVRKIIYRSESKVSRLKRR